MKRVRTTVCATRAEEDKIQHSKFVEVVQASLQLVSTAGRLPVVGIEQFYCMYHDVVRTVVPPHCKLGEDRQKQGTGLIPSISW